MQTEYRTSPLRLGGIRPVSEVDVRRLLACKTEEDARGLLFPFPTTGVPDALAAANFNHTLEPLFGMHGEGRSLHHVGVLEMAALARDALVLHEAAHTGEVKALAGELVEDPVDIVGTLPDSWWILDVHALPGSTPCTWIPKMLYKVKLTPNGGYYHLVSSAVERLGFLKAPYMPFISESSDGSFLIVPADSYEMILSQLISIHLTDVVVLGAEDGSTVEEPTSPAAALWLEMTYLWTNKKVVKCKVCDNPFFSDYRGTPALVCSDCKNRYKYLEKKRRREEARAASTSDDSSNRPNQANDTDVREGGEEHGN